MSRHAVRPVALFVVLALSAPALAEAPAAEPLKGLDEFVARAMKEFEVPGLAVAVVKDGKVVLAKGYGVRALGESAAVDEKTLFAIGSCSKAFTAAALGLLVDEGKVKWDDPVAKHLRGFELYDPYASRELTLRDILSHRCGLDRHDFVWYGSGLGREEILKRIRFAKPASSFRSKYGYQNIMFLAAGQVVPAVTGKSWDDFVTEKLFKPLGMKASNTSVAALPKGGDVATPHERVEEKVQTVPWRNIDNVGPAGSINSNVEDMARWVRFQLGDGTFEKTRLLSSGTLGEMHKSQTVVPLEGPTAKLYPHSHFATYGLGWSLHDYRGRKVVEHGGNIDGMSAWVGLLPEEKLGLVVLTNRGGTFLPAAVQYFVFDAYLHAAPEDWVKQIAAVEKGVRKVQKEAQAKDEKGRVEGTKPSLPLAKYAGVYKDDLYGEVTVKLEGDKLSAAWGPLSGPLEHWQYDTFRGKPAAKRLPKPFASFHVGKDGKVEEVKLSLGTGVEWTAKRTGDGAAPAAPVALGDGELKRFAGKYALETPPLEVSVELVSGKLKLIAPGQPVLGLSPVQPTRFKAEGAPVAVFVEFQVEGNEVKGVQVELPDQPLLKLARKN
jgi:CubicO group peptidase (beta-lactamase class C family)